MTCKHVLTYTVRASILWQEWAKQHGKVEGLGSALEGWTPTRFDGCGQSLGHQNLATNVVLRVRDLEAKQRLLPLESLSHLLGRLKRTSRRKILPIRQLWFSENVTWSVIMALWSIAMHKIFKISFAYALLSFLDPCSMPRCIWIWRFRFAWRA